MEINETDLKCNLCDSSMDYYEFKGTHIWVCQECMNVQFEYMNPEDPQNMLAFLEKRK